MKLVVQRVNKASVNVNNKIVGKIDKGLLAFVGIKKGDTKKEAEYLVKKLINLRIFEDDNEKMNLSVQDINGKVLIISQFTLYGDTSHGNRPSFIQAENPENANILYEYFCDKCNEFVPVEKGIFHANMKVDLENDGPCTIIIESK